jgi:hypothetical protein
MGTAMRKMMVSMFLLAIGVLSSQSAFAARRMVFEEMVIEGEVQKPEVTVSVSRENLNKSYDLNLKESFLPKIIESIDRTPF